MHGETEQSRGPLTGIRVIELADEQAEYCGLTLAGLGADVVKVEPPGGSPTRRIGPFYQDREDRERSLFFWQYNRGKRSIVLDLRQPDDRDRFSALVVTADVLLESTPRGELDGYGLGASTLMQRHPTLIVARVTPFGDHGPWADFKGSHLVHLFIAHCDPSETWPYELSVFFNILLPASYAALEGVTHFSEWTVLKKFSGAARHSLTEAESMLPDHMELLTFEECHKKQAKALHRVSIVMLTDNKNWNSLLESKNDYHLFV